MRKLLLFVITLALASAGCVQNMNDLKDRIGNDEPITPAAVNDTTPTAPTSPPVANVTKTPPVARISIFGTNGALVYKSTFQADDPKDILFVEAKSKLNLIASDSEALERGATLTGFAWTLNGKPIEGGARQASAEIGEAGLYTLTLHVTDSNGKTDTQTVKLGVAPEPYEITLELMTGPIAGGEGQGQGEALIFTLATDAAKGPATVQKVTISAAPDVTLDAILTVTDAEGTVLGEADNAGHTDLDQTETLELGAIALGDYTVTVNPFAGADADGVPITITITFLPTVEGLSGDDGHGGHGGH